MEVLVHVVMLLYPRFQQLDLTGPFEVLARFEELEIHLVWKTLGPVSDVNGLRLMPTETFANCPTADILFVPGGPGQILIMEETENSRLLAEARGRYPVRDLGLYGISYPGSRRTSHRLPRHLPLDID
jgi:putative intracellular protease/amidase